MSATKTAFITGIAGQDGSYLSKFLIESGYTVYGSVMDVNNQADFWRLEKLRVKDQVKLVTLDLGDIADIESKFAEIQPAEIYHLAAQSSVGLSFKQPLETFISDGIYPINLLEVIRTKFPETKFFQASSGEIFGNSGQAAESKLNEQTSVSPKSPYATAKAFAHFAVQNYRDSYQVFACNGIMFNHESPLRAPEFVTRKIALKVVAISKGDSTPLEIGNMDSKRDWGYAAEYVQAIHAMLQHETADDYVVSTGELHSVREFIEAAFKLINKEIVWEGSGTNEIGKDKNTQEILVKVNPEFYRPIDVAALGGDSSKIKQNLGWEPKVKFSQLVEELVKAELN